MPSKTPLLTEFLLATETQLRIFDMSRRITKISLSNFQQFERAETPYPYPYEQTAWIGLIYWSKKNKAQHNIWFIRIPLDETGLIQLSARDEFMHLILSRFNEFMQNNESSPALEHVLKDNPYVFKPTEDKMAVFHSKALQTLKQAPTQYFSDALQYIQGDNFENWQNLGVQGIADVAIRFDQKDILQPLLRALEQMPEPVFNVFCQCIENESIDIKLGNTIFSRMKESDSAQLKANGIRALANCQSSQLRESAVCTMLAQLNPSHHVVLIAVAAKSWEVFDKDETLTLFLNKLANKDVEADLFNALISDLMFMPGLRNKILTAFRDPERPEDLAIAVGKFFQSIN